MKCGGHGILGLAVPEAGLLIDLSPMGEVRVDPARRRANVQGGALLGTLDRTTDRHGLATTAGNVSHTGVGGLTLGGGMGWLARQFGLACDNVETYTVVTADGETVRASATEHPDLYWGLRGGGGNFGVVTEFEFRLHPTTGQALSVECYFDPFDRAGIEAVRVWRDLLPSAPREATLTCDTITAGEPPFLPQRLHGRPVVIVGFVWVGDMAEARAYLADSAGSARRRARTSARCATSTSRAAAMRGITMAFAATRPATTWPSSATRRSMPSWRAGSDRVARTGLVDDARWRVPGLRRRDRRGRRRRLGVQPP